MSSSGKSMRLHFKGDKPEKKRKKSRSDKEGNDGSGSSSKGKKRAEEGESDVDEVGGDEQAWVPARHPTDLSGPIVIYQGYSPSSSLSQSDPSSSKKFYAITLNPTLQKMALIPLTPPEPLAAQLSAQDKAQLEGAQIIDWSSLAASTSSEGLAPSDVHQVLVASRVLDTADPPRYTLRTTEHRFLGADKHGTLLCGAEARGPQEEWSLSSASASTSEPGAEHANATATAGLAFRSMHGTYLCLDEVPGGKLVLRVDSSSVGAAETWSASVQWKFRHQARQGERAREIGKGKGEEGLNKRLKLETGGTIDEKSLMKSRQSYTLGKTPMYSSGDDHADRKALKRAIKEGRAAEELLDRRSKMKSDKFA